MNEQVRRFGGKAMSEVGETIRFLAGVVAVGDNQLVVIYDIYNYQPLPPEVGPVGNTVFSFRMTVDRG